MAKPPCSTRIGTDLESCEVEFGIEECPAMHATRREFLTFTTSGLAGSLAPSGLARATRPAEAAAFGKARSCILVYLLGGPSHLDMWDLKPLAPAEVRGPFKPIATSISGIQLSEHLPRLAKRAAHFALLRSVSYPNNDHPYMVYYTHTGRVSPVPLGDNTVLPPSRIDYPHTGAVVAKYHHRAPSVPGYVAIPEVRVRMAASPFSGGGRAGFLGPAYDPLAVNDDVRTAPAELRLPADVNGERFANREHLLVLLEGRRGNATGVDHDAYRARVRRMLQASGQADLFALDKEPARLRERYGTHRFGQSLLLARRLVEGGVSLVAVHFNYMSKCDGWDTHAKNFDCLKGELLPLLDQGLSALLDDLSVRGLLDSTLVVCMGEFGRTPKINGAAGRDHWGACASVALAGGGVRGGQVVGASDRIGAYPRELPVDPADVQATIYHCFGLQPETEMRDQLGRPMPVSVGKVIRQVF
jgi:hypothetical protein